MVPGMVAPIPMGILEVAIQLMVATRKSIRAGEYSLSSSKVCKNRSITEMHAICPINWERMMVMPQMPSTSSIPLLP